MTSAQNRPLTLPFSKRVPNPLCTRSLKAFAPDWPASNIEALSRALPHCAPKSTSFSTKFS